MSCTCTTLAGTWRGVVLSRICFLTRSISPASSVCPSCSLTKSTTRTSSASARRPVLADHQRFEHFRQLFDLAVDLRRADAHPARVQRRVGTAVDDHAVMCGELREVAVAPDVGETLEIGGTVAWRRPGRSRSRPASPGRAGCTPARPSRERTGLPSSSNTSTAMPRPRHWISPR